MDIVNKLYLHLILTVWWICISMEFTKNKTGQTACDIKFLWMDINHQDTLKKTLGKVYVNKGEKHLGVAIFNFFQHFFNF